ncbi:MAG TPA: hypothetical protein VMX17_05290, partial [Candidatus Glassbacteria bacterium]|nr:hypothetical protein [Candidatus Glassbacteria bacterium]
MGLNLKTKFKIPNQLFFGSKLNGEGMDASLIMEAVRERSVYDFVLGPNDNIQEAIDRLPPEGGRILLEKGDYLIKVQLL